MHLEYDCVQQLAETAQTGSVVSTAETISTPHASAERTAHLKKTFGQLGSFVSTLQDFWSEALAAGIDGNIKLQAAELQELEDARQRAWISECAAVTDKLARIQEPKQLEETSVGHVEEDAWHEASSEVGKQVINASMQGHHLDEEAASGQDVGQAGLGAFGGAMGKARRSTHGPRRGRNRVAGCTVAGTTWSSARRCWTMTVQAWWSKSPQGARN